MRESKPFFDTNVLVYAYSEAGLRSRVADELMTRRGIVSVQVLNEFVAVFRGKLRRSLNEVRHALGSIEVLCPSPVPVTLETHKTALGIMTRYGYGIYDALVIAAALEASCRTLYSEDMQDGQTIEKLTIRNPFNPD